MSAVLNIQPAPAPQKAPSASSAKDDGADASSERSSGTVPASTSQSKKKQTKRRKVNLACIYCRRSHMTCDEGRPCQRCIKRDIGHLCHDESTSRNASAPHSAPARRPSTQSRQTHSPLGHSPTRDSSSPFKDTRRDSHSSEAASGILGVAPTLAPRQSGPHSMLASGPSDAGPMLGNGLALGALQGNSNSPFISGGTGPYSSSSALGSIAANSGASLYTSGLSGFRNGASMNAGLGGLSLAGGVSMSGSGNTSGQGFGGTSMGWSSSLGGAGWLGLGGGPGGLDGGGAGAYGDSAGGNEFNILSEFLESLDSSSFLNTNAMSTSTPATSTGILPASSTPGPGPAPGPSSRRNTISAQPQRLEESSGAVQSNGDGVGRASLPPSTAQPSTSSADFSASSAPATTAPAEGAESSDADARGTKRPRVSSTSDVVPNNSGKGPRGTQPASNTPSGSASGGAYAPVVGASKTERFFLTAADQNDGTRDERLGRVIQAKYEAGLLRPYNHVNGYARLNRWMERNVCQASRHRILKPLSVFRPAFRAVAQSLTNIDLIFIEEAFERLLLDYDRVFSTQGIPACLWRRTGEIYKGNKEFAELVGVQIEALREGRLCIYELMAEESAVNYWEKYGAVSFDPGQKAVLTSCVLRTNNVPLANTKKVSSATAIAAQLPRSHMGSGGTTTPNSSAAPGAKPLSSSTQAGASAQQQPAEGSTTSYQPPTTPARGGNAELQRGAQAGSRRSSLSAQATKNENAAAASVVASGAPGSSKKEEESGVAYINCCFSFTIRRDQWNIPTMIVGNFLPTSPP